MFAAPGRAIHTCNLASKRRSTLFQIALVSRIFASARTIAVQELIVTIIPITLLWVVRLNLRLKLEVCAVFCLTLFTMIAAVVRVVMSLKGKREDDSGLFAWSAVESAIGTVTPVYETASCQNLS